MVPERQIWTIAGLVFAIGFAALAGAVSAGPVGSPARPADPLADAFENPSPESRPLVDWDWLDGNVSKRGIEADLDAIRHIGLGGVLLSNVDAGLPGGSTLVPSKEWESAVRYSVDLSGSLGISLGSQLGAGTAASGGAWIKPDDAMKTLVASEVVVHGPVRFDQALPQPETGQGYYRDVAVIAFPTPAAEKAKMDDLSATASGSQPSIDDSVLMSASPRPFAWLPQPEKNQPQYLQIDFKTAETVRTMTLQFGPGTSRLAGVVQALGDDGAYRDVQRFEFRGGPGGLPVHTVGLPAANAASFRIVFTGGDGTDGQISVGRVGLLPRGALSDLQAKGLAELPGDPIRSFVPDAGASSPDVVIDPRTEIDLSSRLCRGSRLAWDAPAGDWTIFRIGATLTGALNSGAPPASAGLQCDKLSKGGALAAFSLVDRTAGRPRRPAAGGYRQVFVPALDDGGQNWTDDFRAEFERRRGYDCLPMLPVLGGHIVRSVAFSERFLWDLRKTVSELACERFYGGVQALAHAKGLELAADPAGSFFDPCLAAQRVDVVFADESDLPQAAAIARGAGKAQVEARIGSDIESPDQVPLAAMQRAANAALAGGANRLAFRGDAHQPFAASGPGVVEPGAALRFDRNETWWGQSSALIAQLSRSESVLQQGAAVSDVLCYAGETDPAHASSPPLPYGYHVDVCGSYTILSDLSVVKGCLKTADGRSYRLLVLPDETGMRPEILARLKSLAEEGAVIVGRRPNSAAGLAGYPQADGAVRDLVADMWGAGDQNGAGERIAGKGRVVWGKPVAAVLEELGCPPDVTCARPDVQAACAWTHRTVADADIYFLANTGSDPIAGEFGFRVPGGVPEFWHPDTGLRETAAAYRSDDKAVYAPIALAPGSAVFVVFRRGMAGAPHFASIRDCSEPGPAVRVIVTKASWDAVDGSASLDVTRLLQERMDSGSYLVRASNSILGSPAQDGAANELRVEYTVDGRPHSAVAAQDQFFQPEGADAGRNLPCASLHASDSGLEVDCWKDSVFEYTTEDGISRTQAVSGAGDPVELDGPWNVSFTPRAGAGLKAVFPRLMSWTESDDPRVKFFSGSAIYEKEFAVDSSMRRDGSDLYLDLGVVKDVAEVSLNGKPLAVLWQPPFVVDVSSAVKIGTNRLSIGVAGSWTNRLIGDAQLPDDAAWRVAAGGAEMLSAWPSWLIAGRARPSGRLAFCSIKTFTKDSPLLESGLLGPVVLRKVEKVIVTPP